MLLLPALVWEGPSFADSQDLEFDVLKGKWMRPDGGYVIDIKNVGENGKLDAAYYNPSPINVAEAQVSRDGDTIKVYVELRDVNYPGSNYHLVYDPASDQLKGDYYQALFGEHYDIFFVRME